MSKVDSATSHEFMSTKIEHGPFRLTIHGCLGCGADIKLFINGYHMGPMSFVHNLADAKDFLTRRGDIYLILFRDIAVLEVMLRNAFSS